MVSRSEVSIFTATRYRGPITGFRTLLKHMDTSIGSFSVERRCNLATEIGHESSMNSPDLFLAALGCSPKSLAGLMYETRCGRRQTFLHVVAEAVGDLFECAYSGKNCSPWFSIRPEEFKRYIGGWKTVLHGLLVGGDPLAIARQNWEQRLQSFLPEIEEPMTPLVAIFHSSHRSWRSHRYGNTMNRAFDWWLQALCEFGIDLMDYGLKEKSIWANKDVFRECEDCWFTRFEDPYDDKSDPTRVRKRLITFTFGPRPNDWIFWENELSQPMTLHWTSG